MLMIDGSFGEGGGQILRTALSLALATGQEVRIEKIRAGREKPGLQRQHLAAVEAAAALGQACVEGAELGSREILFRPGPVAPGDYSFSVGTAGSATLVLQTILPALLTAAAPAALLLEGGTHNPLAPPFEFLAKTYLPLINRLGPRVRAKLDRHGFYPAGGGKMRVTIEPAPKLAPFSLLERGRVIDCRCAAIVANLPRHIAEREIKVLKRELDLDIGATRIEEVKSYGPGNVVAVEVESESVTEVFVGFGEQGVRAEIVAGRLAKEVRRYLDAEVPVGEHLADQLLLPLALAGGGSFITFPLSAHTTTNIEVLKRFLPIEVKVAPISDRAVRVDVERAADRDLI
ncbi:MAG: RNA 3'-terminal phosphate cyclase [Verrucomicrobia bacterium]|nr:RNA 3'-terminal phosphate cyclase [Verrucomicrobiota bacterium]